MPRDAVIVSTARTPIGRAYKGAFNATPGADAGRLFAEAPAIERAGIDAARSTTSLWGAVLTQGTQFGNIGRQVALRAGCPVGVSRHDHRSPMLLGPDGHRHRGQADRHRPDGYRRCRRAGFNQHGPDAGDADRARSVADGDAQACLHADAAAPPRRSPNATASAASGRTNMRSRAQQRTAAAQAAGRFEAEIVPVTRQ